MIIAASSYPLGGVLWSMFVFFAWFLWFWLLFMVYADLFRRDDIGGWGKTGWVVFTLFLPFIGVLTYLISQGRSMADRGVKQARRQQEELDEYVRSVATGNGNGADQLIKAKSLLDSGAITPEEFEQMKRKVLV